MAEAHLHQMIELMPREQWNVDISEMVPTTELDSNGETILAESFKSMVYSEETRDNGQFCMLDGLPVETSSGKSHRAIEHTAVDNMDLSVFKPMRPVHMDALLSAVMSAFNNHHPIVFTPDLVYGYLAKGIAIHIEKFPEELRSLFVSHTGKKDLLYSNESFVRGCKDNDWADMFKTFADQLKEKTKDNSVVQNDLKFSTSTPMTEAHRHVLSMDSMKSYFDFKCITLCGISCVILEGNLEDWKLLQETVTSQLAEINKYCEDNPESKSATLDWWSPAVEVMLENFRETYTTQSKGEEIPDDLKHWWSTIYKYNAAEGSGSTASATGWINTFYPYIGERDRNPWIVLCSSCATDKKQSLRKRFKSYFLMLKNKMFKSRQGRPPWEIDLDDYPSYVATVPFTWEYLGEELKMNILIGYSLLGKVAVEGSLYPRGTLKVFPSWVIYYKDIPLSAAEN